MAAIKAPLLGGAKKEVSLDEAVFGAEVKPHLVHEAVRAELNARRQGTRAAKSRGLVAGEDEETLIKSFRNLRKVLVTVPAELEVAHVVWARSLVVSEAALPQVQGRAS